jgi:membrane protease YdiL (CAAX protease family)
MTNTTTAPAPPAPSGSALRRAVASHPVTTQLIAMAVAVFGVLVPVVLAGLPIEPFLLGCVLLLQLLPAVLISAAVGGRPAVRELFSRVFRWRVQLRWYLLAFLLIPVCCLAVSTVYGPGNWIALVTDPAVILAFLNQLTILPLINLWEETAWTGMVQDPLGRRFGPVAAACITGPLFGLSHLPLRIGEPDLVRNMLPFMVLAVGMRLVLGWLYYSSGRSILIAAIVHVTYNATNNGTLLTNAAHNALLDDLSIYFCAVLGLALIVATRGRLGMTARIVTPEPAPAAVLPSRSWNPHRSS